MATAPHLPHRNRWACVCPNCKEGKGRRGDAVGMSVRCWISCIAGAAESGDNVLRLPRSIGTPPVVRQTGAALKTGIVPALVLQTSKWQRLVQTHEGKFRGPRSAAEHSEQTSSNRFFPPDGSVPWRLCLFVWSHFNGARREAWQGHPEVPPTRS